MRKIKYFIILMFLIALSGCTGSPININNVNIPGTGTGVEVISFKTDMHIVSPGQEVFLEAFPGDQIRQAEGELVRGL